MEHPRTKSASARSRVGLLLVAGLAFSLLGLTQCRMAENRVTGVDLNASSVDANHASRSRCERKCRDRYFVCRYSEAFRHHKAVRACDKGKTRAERRSCREKEERRHDSELKACRNAFDHCKRDCRYNEGGGSGGR